MNLDKVSMPELKRIALEELKVTKDQVRNYGKLTYRQTWINAILEIREGIKQLTISDALPLFSGEPDSPVLENIEKNDISSDCDFLAEYGDPIIKGNQKFKAATSNELEVAASKDGFLYQGSKKKGFSNPDVANTEAVLPDDDLIIEDESSQLPEPEIINITPEEYPEIWEILQPPETEEKQGNYTINLTNYEVIQSSPEPDLHTCTSTSLGTGESSPESLGAEHPKFPLEDFLKALFLGPQALVPNQSA